MAGSNALAVKTALVGLFRTALAGPPPVRVDDAYNSKNETREYVYFGHIAGPQEPMVFRNGARQPRVEELVAQLHVEVMKPNVNTAATDTRALAIGQIIEETLANDPKLGGAVQGLMGAWMTHFQLTSFYPEDGKAASEILYQITFQSMLG